MQTCYFAMKLQTSVYKNVIEKLSPDDLATCNS